jgi:hypothetical protein
LSHWRLRGACLLLLCFSSCSRASSGDAPHADGSAPVATPPLLTSTVPDIAASPSAGPILTPEDVEQETEHRITEQNLERELDRLEREIQGE